jgi:glycerate kinase
VQPAVPVVVAPDSFKGTLTAPEAAAAIERGLLRGARDAGRQVQVRSVPVSDGGDGLVEVLLAAGFTRHVHPVPGPLGDPVEAAYATGADDDGTPLAVVELAAAAGLSLLPTGPDRGTARTSSTDGVGQLVGAALDGGARRIVVGLGGSATTDGGVGLARALGARFLDADGRDLATGGSALVDLARVDVTGLDPRLADVELVIACDVDNPLTGPTGAAATYGPQKGADADTVALLDEGLRRLAGVLRRDTGVDVADLAGGGAAGGTPATALALLGARLVPGVELVLRLVGLERALAGAALVVTGEGCLDAQSLRGKAPIGVARAAAGQGAPVILLAGRVDLDPAGQTALGSLGSRGAHGLAEVEPDPDRRTADAGRTLERLAATVLPPVLASLPVPADLPRSP